MNFALILFAALLPVVILLCIILFLDRKRPEPAKKLFKAFFFGILSVFLSFCISIPLGELGVYSDEFTTVLGSFGKAFFGAAIPEEIAKFFMLWLLLRKNRYFDEMMDGIVYAACIGLGFEAIENIMYIINAQDFISTAIMRAITPWHFCFGILMGYYYSLAKFVPSGKTKNYILMLAAPILAHGIYDALLMSLEVLPVWMGIPSILFCFYFCYKMCKISVQKIKEHLEYDKNTIADNMTQTDGNA